MTVEECGRCRTREFATAGVMINPSFRESLQVVWCLYKSASAFGNAGETKRLSESCKAYSRVGIIYF